MAKGKRKDGLLEKKITIKGKQYHIYGKTVSELLENEAAKREEINAGYFKRQNPTIRAYCDKWLENIADSISGNSRLAYESQLNKICQMNIADIQRTFGDIKIKDVTPDDIRAIQTALSEKRISTSVNGSISLINRVFREAQAERLIEHNPCDIIKTIKRTEERARNTYHRALTKEEQKAFFESELTKSSIYYNVYRLAINTGMRIGEICALKASDIHNDMIHIERTITKSESGALIVGDSAKTQAGRRNIPINDNVRKIIEDQKQINAVLYRGAIIDFTSPLQGLLFKTPDNAIISNNYINKEIAGICKTLGIDTFTSHAFRDTFATRAIESGIDPKTLQEILGHSNIAMTLNLYAHVMDDTKKAAMDKIIIAI
ncbi:MAG: site-specific integrase [Lachnospiraceae bacterium]|nr:site-specific integrase [Lachnospiraceae bacterium]